MNQRPSVPLLHLRGDADPYVLADPVDRTQRYAPHGRYVSIAGAGHFSHEEAPEEINRHLMQVSRARARAAGQLTQAPVCTCWVPPILAS